MKYLLMTLLMFFGPFAYAEILNFECTYSGRDGKVWPVSHSVDMTNKTWERTAGGTTEIFEDVVVSSNRISVTGTYPGTVFDLRKVTNVISRVDLSYSYSFQFYDGDIWGSPKTYEGQCKIVEAPPVEKAF